LPLPLHLPLWSHLPLRLPLPLPLPFAVAVAVAVAFAVAFAVEVAFLVVIPEGDLRLHLSLPALLLSFRSAAEESASVVFAQATLRNDSTQRHEKAIHPASLNFSQSPCNHFPQ
jgi:hypothetical protein